MLALLIPAVAVSSVSIRSVQDPFETPSLNLVSRDVSAPITRTVPRDVMRIVDAYAVPAFPYAVSFFYGMPSADFMGFGYMQATLSRPEGASEEAAATERRVATRDVPEDSCPAFDATTTVGELKDRVLEAVLGDEAASPVPRPTRGNVECCDGIRGDPDPNTRTVSVNGEDVHYGRTSIQVFQLRTRTQGAPNVEPLFDSLPLLVDDVRGHGEADGTRLGELRDLAVVLPLRFCARTLQSRQAFGWGWCRGAEGSAVTE